MVLSSGLPPSSATSRRCRPQPIASAHVDPPKRQADVATGRRKRDLADRVTQFLDFRKKQNAIEVSEGVLGWKGSQEQCRSLSQGGESKTIGSHAVQREKTSSASRHLPASWHWMPLDDHVQLGLSTSCSPSPLVSVFSLFLKTQFAAQAARIPP